MSEYSVDRNASADGTSLQEYLPGVSARALENAFGPGVEHMFDDEKGYGGPEWVFRADNGAVFNVYARWDEYRIGANPYATAWTTDAQYVAAVADFKDWLLARICAPRGANRN